MKIRKLLAAAFGCFALLFGTTAAHAAETTTVAKIGETPYSSLNEALNAAVAANDGTPVEILRDITFAPGDTWTPVTFSAHATLVVNGNGKTITGIPGMLLDVYAAGGGAQTLRMRELTFKDAKVENAGSRYGAGHEANQHVSVILGYGGNVSELTFEKVTVDHATVTGDEYAAAFVAFATLDSDDSVVSFTDCKVLNSTITGGGSVGALMGHANANTVGKVVVSGEATEIRNNTIVSNEADASKVKAGAVFGSVGNAPTFVSANVRGNNVTSSGNPITTVYGRQASVGGRLFLTGGTYDHAPLAGADAAWATVAEGFELKQGADNTYAVSEVKYVAQVGDTKYASLAAALNAGMAIAVGGTVEIIDDITFAEGDAWTPVDVRRNNCRITVNGNGHTIANLPGMMFSPYIPGGCWIRVSNLTLKTPKVSGVENAAVFAGFSDWMNELTFTDVTIDGAEISGSNYAGGFVSYATFNDNPRTATFTRCKVINSKIVGGNSAGALMGHACGSGNGTVTVVAAEVRNNVIACTKAGKMDKAGAVFGTVGSSPVTVDADVSGNTVYSGGQSVEDGAVAITTVCGRQGDVGTLTVMGGSYDSEPIAADAAWAGVSANCTLKEAQVDGKTVYTVAETAVAKIKVGEVETEYADLAAALKAAVAAKNATVTILRDITFGPNDTWTPVRIGKNTTLVVNGNGKTITGLPGCLFGTTHESEMQTDSSLTMTNLKFVNPKVRVNKPKIYGDSKDYSFAAVILAEAYGMDATLEKVEIEGADVRGGDDCYTAGFVGWCNDKSSDPDAKHPVVRLQNCALCNSTIIGCGTAAGLVGHVAASENGESVILIVTDCEVVNNTIVCTEEGKNNKAGAVVATIAAEGATVSAKVSGNKVYSGKGSLDDTDDTTWKTGTEITTVYGRRGGSGTLSLTGGTYDHAPLADADTAWATVAEGFELKQGADNTYAVSEVKYVAQVGDTKYASLAAALKAGVEMGKEVSIIDDITFDENDSTWETVALKSGSTLVVKGNGYTIKNLPGMLLNVPNGGAECLRMSDLKFVAPKAVDSGSDYVAVILGYADYTDELTFTNVSIEGATVTGNDYVAAFVAWAALVDGDSRVTFTGCKVTGSMLTGGGSTGALMGHANCAANGTVTVVDCEISGNTITCTEAESKKAGAVFGTVGDAPAFVSAKVERNVVKSGNSDITTVCGRLGHSDSTGTLTLTGGTYDTAPIAGLDPAKAGVSANCALKTTQEDGKTVYTVAETAVAKIKVGEVETEYADLAAALNAAVAAKNATVTILRNITFGPNDTWTPVKIGSDKTLVVNGNGKTITGLPGCLFGSMLDTGDVQDGSSLTMTNLKFVNPKKIRVNQPKSEGPSFAAVVLALAYGMDVTFDGVEIEGADVRGGDDCFVAGFVGWCNGMSGRNTVTLRNCALRNSTLVSCGSAGGLVAYTTVTPNQAVELVIENCEVTGNTIVCTELEDGAPRTDIVGSVVASIGAGDATVSATVSDNSVYGSTSAIDAETLAKNTDEVTTVYGRSKGGTLSLTGGSYDARPFAKADAAWAKVAEGCTLAGNDTDGWTVEYFVKANGVGYATLEAAFAAAEPDAGGVVTYEIGGKAEVTGAAWVKILKGGLAGVTQVKFVGTTADAEICLVTAGSILSEQAYDVDVTFTDLTLSRLNPAWVGDIGHGANYFSTWLRNLNAVENTVTYTRCTFPNGVCNNPYGKTVFNDCIFSNGAEGLFNLWVYGGDVKVNGGTFTGTRGVKVYNEGAARDDISVKIANTTFRGLTEKAAVVASKQADIALDNIVVTDCAQGFFAKELAGEIDPTKESWMSISANGTAISGTFNITTSMASTALKTEFNLTGGTFTAAVDADYCAKGYEPTANDDGTYGVQAHIIAKVGTDEFNSLADALNAAVAAKNATVEIVGDITFEAGDTWTPVRIGSDKTLVVNGNGKTIKNLPGCLFGTTHETEAQFGSVFTMTNLKFENPKIRVEAPGMTCAAVVLALAYGMDVTLDGVEIDGADVRGGSDSYVAGFVGWCNGVSGGGRKTVALRNCALRNSTLVSCGSVGGLVASTTPTLNEAVELVVENCEVVGNTIVGTELKGGVPRTELVGSVVGSIGAGDATVSATVSGNSVYGSTSAVDAETLTKDTDEVTAVYGRGNGGELTITGGTYDARPFNAGDDWAKVGEWSTLVEQDGVFKVVDNLATLGNVKARQRYPWNGLVDVTFELKSKNAARVFIVAEYVDGGETKRLPMAAAKLVNDDKSERDVDVSTGFTVPARATAKTVHVIWDSTAAVPTRLSGVTFRVYAK